MRAIDVDPRLDLYLLLYPSFALPMFSVSRDRLEKLWGVCKGLKMRRTGPRLEVEHEERWCRDYADEVLGLWSLPSSTSVVSRRYRDFVEILLYGYEWLGIATSSLDDLELFTSIFLSRNTDFHKNVVRWFRRIYEGYGSAEALKSVPIESVTRYIGRSYQVVQLVQAIASYTRHRERIRGGDMDEARRLLLGIEGVGPKSFHAYALYVRRSKAFAPVDKNLVQFLKRFEITSDLVADAPKKSTCLSYPCEHCPMSSRCTYHRVSKAFGELSGWIQTVAYLHNKMVCRYSLCKSCFLKPICGAPRERRPSTP